MSDAFEPLYTLKVAAVLIPFASVPSLRNWISLHSNVLSPAKYQRTGYGTTRIRLLTVKDLRTIRRLTVVASRNIGGRGKRHVNRHGKRPRPR